MFPCCHSFHKRTRGTEFDHFPLLYETVTWLIKLYL